MSVYVHMCVCCVCVVRVCVWSSAETHNYHTSLQLGALRGHPSRGAIEAGASLVTSKQEEIKTETKRVSLHQQHWENT